jgi:acyl-CoA reductase-like NAD-dependent aldehyde dehydrogenase
MEQIAKQLIGSHEELGELVSSTNSSSQDRRYSFVKSSIEDAKRALVVAQNAFVLTRKSKLSDRVLWLDDVVKNLETREDEFAKVITDEVGKPIRFSKVEVSRCIETLKLSIAAMIYTNGQTINSDAMPSGSKSTSFYKRVPSGVIVCITPFNFPLNLLAHKLAPAIVSGNSVVIKPTPEAPMTAYMLAKLFIDSKYAIKDAVSLVYGDGEIGDTLVSSPIPAVVSFTGSVAVGDIITKRAGIKKLSLELGGNAGTFIDKSADLHHAVKQCAVGAFINSGQVCISLQRIYVHEDIVDQFEKLFVEEVKKLSVGDPHDEETFLGPLINERAVTRAKKWIEEARNSGAKILTGGEVKGLTLYPTVVSNVTNDMKLVCEEVFAPIVSIVKVSGIYEALSELNNSPYGLQHSIFTNDLNSVNIFIEECEAGGVVVNDMPTLRYDIQPYGGVKLSGIGKEGPSFAIEEFTTIKSIVIKHTRI